MRSVHQCSLYSVYLEAGRVSATDNKETIISKATGSLYETNGDVYLITNWHVFSDCHAETQKSLDTKNASLIEYVKVHFLIDGSLDKKNVVTYPLKDKEGNYLWLEHPLKNQVDVAALKIDVPTNTVHFHINEIIRQPSLGDYGDLFFVSQEVWVIGFPLGIMVGPIWKRASIASEPNFFASEPTHKILLDTATRQGMSGSPVMFVNRSLTPIQFDGREQRVDLPSVKCLMGIYSGRIEGKDEMAAQLGIVWHSACIAEIIEHGKVHTCAGTGCVGMVRAAGSLLYTHTDFSSAN